MNYDYWYPKMKEHYRQYGQRLPSVSRSVWERRDRALKRDGFLSWERAFLNLHSLNHEATSLMIQDRRKLKSRARMEGWTFKAYEGAIRLDYHLNGWFFRDARYSPFKMLEYYKKMGGIEEEYPDKTKRKKRDYKGLKE